MIEALAEIGTKILDGQSKRDSMIQEIDVIDKKSEQPRHLLKLDFDLEEKKLSLDISEELYENSVKKYLYFGRDGGPNAAQWYATTVNSLYLLVEVVDQLEEKLKDGILKEQLKQVRELFYIDFGESLPVKSRFMLDLYHYLGCLDRPIEEMLQQFIDSGEAKPYKKLGSEVDKALKQYVQDTFSCKKEIIGLFTLCINHEPVATHPDYLQLIEEHFNQDEKAGKKSDLPCSLCGTKEASNYYSDKIDFSVKYYTTNQLIFAHNLNRKNYHKNMVLCQRCYDAVKAAENYMVSRLNTKLAAFDVYLLPHIVWGELDKSELDRLSDNIIYTFDTAKNVENYQEFQNNLDNELYENDPNARFLINIIFYRKANQATKILKFVKDVNPGVFRKMNDALGETQEWLQCYYKNFPMTKVGLEQIYFNTPLKIKDGKPVNDRHVLDLYEAFFNEQKLKRKDIIEDVMACIRIKWFDQGGYNVSNTEKGSNTKYLSANMIRALYYIKFLENYGMIERGDGMDATALDLSDRLKKYIEEMHYSEEETSLFLLGMIISNIGKKQSIEAGYDDNYKPILNKLNVNGMDKAKVFRLSDVIFDKIRQMKIIQQKEGNYIIKNGQLHKVHRELLEKHRDDWSLNKYENIHYILSGYTYGYRPVYKKEKMEESPNE